MHRQVLQLREDHETEDQAEHADTESQRQQRTAVHATDVHLPEIRNPEVGLPSGRVRGLRQRRSRDERGEAENEQGHEELAVHGRESPGLGGKSVTKIDATLRDTLRSVNAKVLELTWFAR